MHPQDIYLYGMTLMTTSYRLAADFPVADSYCEIVESHRLPGGETGTCAVVLAGLGLKARVDGNFLGRNTRADLVSHFADGPISLELMTHDPHFDGLEDIVFLDRETRTAFGRFGQFFADPAQRRWNPANEEAIRDAKVVGVDPFFLEESTDVARLCCEHGVPFATIDCRGDSDIHRLSQVNVVSQEFLASSYPGREPQLLFAEYAESTEGLVVFTFGADNLWFGRKGQKIREFAPWRVEVESTLGAGDAFKAGVIYAMHAGMDDSTLVRFASATAAAACTSYPIPRHPPTLDTVAAIAGEPFR